MILDKIAARTRLRVAERKKIKSPAQLMPEAGAMPAATGFPFEKALRTPDISFICEIKKASPSKGIIRQDFPHLTIAMEYAEAGASAISVVTEPYFFLGSDSYLTEIANAVKLPVLRKDFIIDGYQIYEAKTIGASAVLLICALLDTDTLAEYLTIADSLGLSALVEAHNEKEVQSALKAGARIIGVNNRDLRTFEVDITTSLRLRSLVPQDILFVSESGIKTPEDIAALRDNKADAVLIGETLLRSSGIKEQLTLLRGEDYGEN